MTETALAGPEERDFILSSLSPSLAQERLALGIVLFLAIAFLILAGPLSTIQLAPSNAFIPIYATAMFVIDSITKFGSSAESGKSSESSCEIDSVLKPAPRFAPARSRLWVALRTGDGIRG
jgi:hypothetical protein